MLPLYIKILFPFRELYFMYINQPRVSPWAIIYFSVGENWVEPIALQELVIYLIYKY
jgi:hypothetical protein